MVLGTCASCGEEIREGQPHKVTNYDGMLIPDCCEEES